MIHHIRPHSRNQAHDLSPVQMEQTMQFCNWLLQQPEEFVPGFICADGISFNLNKNWIAINTLLHILITRSMNLKWNIQIRKGMFFRISSNVKKYYFHVYKGNKNVKSVSLSTRTWHWLKTLGCQNFVILLQEGICDGCKILGLYTVRTWVFKACWEKNFQVKTDSISIH